MASRHLTARAPRLRNRRHRPALRCRRFRLAEIDGGTIARLLSPIHIPFHRIQNVPVVARLDLVLRHFPVRCAPDHRAGLTLTAGDYYRNFCHFSPTRLITGWAHIDAAIALAGRNADHFARSEVGMKALITAALLMVASVANAQAQQQPAAPAAPAAPGPAPAARDLGLRVEIEPAALALIKAMSERLAAAKTMSFTALATYESLARTGEPLAYTTLSRVTLQRPDKLRVLTLGDGPATEFYYDGKTAKAYEPAVNLVAVADAPPTIDAMLLAAYQHAAIYFPFTDVIVADPLQDLMKGLQIAFASASRVVGVATDVVAPRQPVGPHPDSIGSDDKLLRMMRATHGRSGASGTLSPDWKLDATIPADAHRALTAAKQIEFKRPTRKPLAGK
jgi:hypothetical protein